MLVRFTFVTLGGEQLVRVETGRFFIQQLSRLVKGSVDSG